MQVAHAQQSARACKRAMARMAREIRNAAYRREVSVGLFVLLMREFASGGTSYACRLCRRSGAEVASGSVPSAVVVRCL